MPAKKGLVGTLSVRPLLKRKIEIPSNQIESDQEYSLSTPQFEPLPKTFQPKVSSTPYLTPSTSKPVVDPHLLSMDLNTIKPRTIDISPAKKQQGRKRKCPTKSSENVSDLAPNVKEAPKVAKPTKANLPKKNASKLPTKDPLGEVLQRAPNLRLFPQKTQKENVEVTASQANVKVKKIVEKIKIKVTASKRSISRRSTTVKSEKIAGVTKKKQKASVKKTVPEELPTTEVKKNRLTLTKAFGDDETDDDDEVVPNVQIPTANGKQQVQDDHVGATGEQNVVINEKEAGDKVLNASEIYETETEDDSSIELGDHDTGSSGAEEAVNGEPQPQEVETVEGNEDAQLPDNQTAVSNSPSQEEAADESVEETAKQPSDTSMFDDIIYDPKDRRDSGYYLRVRRHMHPWWIHNGSQYQYGVKFTTTTVKTFMKEMAIEKMMKKEHVTLHQIMGRKSMMSSDEFIPAIKSIASQKKRA